jgi:hypothetical protein
MSYPLQAALETCELTSDPFIIAKLWQNNIEKVEKVAAAKQAELKKAKSEVTPAPNKTAGIDGENAVQP